MRTDRLPLVLLVLCALLLAGGAPGYAQARRIATLDAIRLRSGPSTTASVVRTLDIAAPLAVEGNASGAWVSVRTADGARGWVRRDLTVPYDAGNPLPALRTIAERSIAMERVSFETRSRLVNVLTDARDATTARPAKAELALLRLRALQKALDEHAARRGSPSGWDGPPLRDGGIRADTSEIAYGEPQGQWLVRADAFWKLRERYRDLPIAERIAWTAATQQLPGECETDPTCLFTLAEITAGRYLSLHPHGAHAAASLRNLAELLGAVEAESLTDGDAWFCTRSGAEYTIRPERIEALARIVSVSDGAERARTTALLRTLASRCT